MALGSGSRWLGRCIQQHACQSWRAIEQQHVYSLAKRRNSLEEKQEENIAESFKWFNSASSALHWKCCNTSTATDIHTQTRRHGHRSQHAKTIMAFFESQGRDKESSLSGVGLEPYEKQKHLQYQTRQTIFRELSQIIPETNYKIMNFAGVLPQQILTTYRW